MYRTVLQSDDKNSAYHIYVHRGSHAYPCCCNWGVLPFWPL